MAHCQGAFEYLSTDFKSLEGWKNSTFWLNIGIMLLTFSKFFRQYFDPILFEMDQNNIDKIENSIMNIEERPFPELFGNKERFIEKIYSPEFIKLCKEFTYNLHPKRFDMDNGFYIDSKGKKYRFGELFKFLQEYDSEWEAPEKVQQRIAKLKQMLNQKTIFSYMVFSRHPIDVLRMSDINDIESCHSKGRMYFDCAQNEAKNLGGIVYIVDKQSVDKIKDHLNDREIFEDPERGIKGIKPKGRIRLRRFIDGHTGEDFAVPEKTYYLPKGNVYGYDDRFIDDILEYVKDKQKISKEKLNTDYIEQNISHVGGQYSDTEYNELLSRFFGMDNYEIGRIKSHTSIPLSNKKILSIIQGIEKSNNPKEVLANMDVEKAFKLLDGIKYWETQEGLQFPKSKDYILGILNNSNLDRYSNRDGINNLITGGTDISKYPKLLDELFYPLTWLLDDIQYDSDPIKEEGIRNFIYKNSDGIKNLLKQFPVKDSSFYQMRNVLSSLVKYLKEKGDPTNLVNFMKQNYLEKMAELDVANRNNIGEFEVTFGESLFKYLDETNQWEEFLTIGGGFYPYEDWLSKFSPRSEMLNYPKAIETSLNLINNALQQGDDSSLLTFSKFLGNDKFAKQISDNYNAFGNTFNNIIKNIVTADLDRISDLKYYLNIGNLLQGNSPLVAEELEKYKSVYIDAFKKVLIEKGKYLSDDYLNRITPILNKLRDNYGWYELKNLQDGPLDIIDDIIRNKNQPQNPNDIKI